MNHPIAYVARLVSEYRRFILEKLSNQSVGRFIVCAVPSVILLLKDYLVALPQATDALTKK
ncbi:MAG: hypothetical protein OXH01_05405 [Bacteroidetes bacterium]|nr:hypothetical protein [Bacteroidota bacterium]